MILTNEPTTKFNWLYIFLKSVCFKLYCPFYRQLFNKLSFFGGYVIAQVMKGYEIYESKMGVQNFSKYFTYFKNHLTKFKFERTTLDLVHFPVYLLDLGLLKIIRGEYFSYFQPLRGALTLRGPILIAFLTLQDKANLYPT